MEALWFERPEGNAVFLRKTPQLASWNKASDPDQVRLRAYLADTEDLLKSSMIAGPWALRLDVGLPPERNLVDRADLDNYAHPLASYLRTDELVSVWCTKQHADTSKVRVAAARETLAPARVFTLRTTASSEAAAFKEQVRSGVAGAEEIPGRAVWLQIAFVVGPRRNWLNLWKPTIDALDPLLGRTRADRDWNPRDGRITELGLHRTIDPALQHEVSVSIAGGPADN